MKIAGVLIIDCWSYREAARRLYPRNPPLQRKWLHAHRQAPGPRCRIGCAQDWHEATPR